MILFYQLHSGSTTDSGPKIKEKITQKPPQRSEL